MASPVQCVRMDRQQLPLTPRPGRWLQGTHRGQRTSALCTPSHQVTCLYSSYKHQSHKHCRLVAHSTELAASAQDGQEIHNRAATEEPLHEEASSQSTSSTPPRVPASFMQCQRPIAPRSHTGRGSSQPPPAVPGLTQLGAPRGSTAQRPPPPPSQAGLI